MNAYQQLGIAAVDPSTTAGFFERNKARVTAVLSGASLAVASAVILSKEEKTEAERVAACLGIGFGVQAVGEALAPLAIRRKVQKLMANFTLPAMFTLTQTYFNEKNESVQRFCVSAILGLGGALAAQMVSCDIEKGAQILSESVEEIQDQGQLIGPPFFSLKVVVLKRWAFSGGLGAFWYVYQGDAFVDAYCSFFVPFFIANGAGAVASHLVHSKIRTFELLQPLLEGLEVRRTRWRLVLLALDMSGKVLPFCFLLPIQTTGLAVAAGTAMGLVDGLTERSQQERLGHLPIDQASELQPDPNVPDVPMVKHAWTAAMVGAFTAFFSWQQRDRLSTESDRRALSILYSTALTAFGFRRIVDLKWNRRVRTQLHDAAMRTLILAPRTPLLLYFVASNSLDMSSRSLAARADLSYQLAADLAWAGYGAQLGLETAGALSEKQGSPFDYPLMPFVIAVLTAKGQLR